MARPTTITVEKILEAARAVFVERGYGDATTAIIAKRAGVSEGSLFNRFRDKVALFHAAMDIPEPDFLDQLGARVGKGKLRDNLERLALDGIEFIEHSLPKVMLLLSNRALWRTPMPAEAPPIRALRTVASYFGAEMRLGRMRRADPEVTARLFMGALRDYSLMKLIAGDVMPMPRETYVRSLVDQLWNGLEP